MPGVFLGDGDEEGQVFPEGFRHLLGIGEQDALWFSGMCGLSTHGGPFCRRCLGGGIGPNLLGELAFFPAMGVGLFGDEFDERAFETGWEVLGHDCHPLNRSRMYARPKRMGSDRSKCFSLNKILVAFSETAFAFVLGMRR